MRLTSVLALCLTVFSTVSVCAQDSKDSPPEAFSLKGFGTLGLARSNHDGAEFVRDLSQPRGLNTDWSSKVDSLLGVQVNFPLRPDTEAVMQVISRYRFNGGQRPEVSWAFLRHELTPESQFRVGRLGTEFYMQADSRMIGYSNVMVRPPPDFYGSLVFSYFDGLDATASAEVAGGVLKGKLFAGRSPESSPFVEPVTWSLKGSTLVGGYLDYFTGPWQFRIGHAEVKFSSNELPLNYLAVLNGMPAFMDLMALAPELSTVNKRARFDSLGLIYDRGALQVQGMLGRISHESESYEDSHSGFVTASYRLGEFTPYIGYSQSKSQATTLSSAALFGAGLAPLAQALTAATHVDQHTVTLGTRWDFRQNWALKVQLDTIRGDPSSLFAFRGPAPNWNGRMKVLSMTLDFAF
jgi:hypothetical protein